MGEPPDFCKAQDLDVFCFELLVAKPKPLSVIDEDLQRLRRSIAKDEHPAVEGIVLQHLFAEACQTVDPAAKIDRLKGRHDPHLGRDLNHGCWFQKLRLSAAKSGIATLLSSIRIFAPSAFSNSKRHWQGPAEGGGVSSMNGMAMGSRADVAAASCSTRSLSE
jgi:hypothetical protein